MSRESATDCHCCRNEAEAVWGKDISRTSAKGEDKAAHVITLAFVTISEDSENLGRGLEGDDRLGNGKARNVSLGNRPGVSWPGKGLTFTARFV